jgi:hypothetical protein
LERIDNPLDVIDQKLPRHVECAALRHVVCGCFLQFSPDLNFPLVQSLYLLVEGENFGDVCL